MSTSDPSAPTADQPPSDGRRFLTPSDISPEHRREVTGTMIGPYKILQIIGEGGFGSVYLAEQERPVVRRVALKIIKLGMDTRQFVARFEQERQALAIMDHPNIAKVLDAGATDSGRPYFVMELVKGEPIVEYCDRRSFSVHQRLELFAQTCAAVQHAHTKGIIHRDLKPSNVLVGEQDGRPMIKVIDFGIAKATGGRLTEKTLFTEHRQLIGTPEYMSPEQAGGSLDIDTRSDVYSLGVLLYELLTGTTPFSSQELRSGAYAEIQRMIREVEPPRPSTRLNQSRDTLASVAAQRSIEPRRLGTLLRGELDWIVMKAMEKDRHRRYDTAGGLASDVRRFLSGEAVLAAPPSRSYRLKKFAQRNRAQVLAALLILLALVLGLAGTIWQARAAAEQRDHAQAEAQRADERAVAASTAEAQARARSQELQRVADFQATMFTQIDPAIAGVRLGDDIRARYNNALATALVPEDQRPAMVDAFIAQWSRVSATDAALELIDTTILKPAAGAIDTQFKDQPAIAASLRHALAERYHSLGLDAQALALEEQTLAQRRSVLGADHPDTLLSVCNIGVYLMALGKYQESEPYCREAMDKGRRILGEEDPGTLMYIANAASLFMATGRLSEAEPLFREVLGKRRRVLGENHVDTLESINEWGLLLEQQGKLADSETYLRDALARRRKALGEDHRSTLSSMNDLAVILKSQGKLDDSIALFREAIERKRQVLGETHPSTLTSIQSLGAVFDLAGRPVEAEALMREALTKQQKLLGADHASTLTTLGNFCVFLIGQNKFAEAEPLCRETLERRTRVLGPNHTATLIANNVMGLCFVKQGKLDEGERYWKEAQAISTRTVGPAHPETLTYTHNLGSLALDRKDYAKAEGYFREVIADGLPALGKSAPVVLSAHRRLGAVLLELKKYPEAIELLSGIEADCRKAYTGPNERSTATMLRDLALARAAMGQHALAEPGLLEAAAIFAKTRGPAHADTRSCAQALADFYAAWDKAEPGKGYDSKGADWKAKLESAK